MKLNKRYLKFIRSQPSYTSQGITYTGAGYPIIDIKSFCKRKRMYYTPELEFFIDKNSLRRKLDNMVEFSRRKYEGTYTILSEILQNIMESNNSIRVKTAIIKAETCIIKSLE